MTKTLIWDIEILNAIPERDGSRPYEAEGIKYAGGFLDHANLGIACIGVWDYVSEMPMVFCADNLDEFVKMADSYDVVVGFNSINFDSRVLYAANVGFSVSGTQYDILRELWISDGLDPENFNPRTHGGYGLDACSQVNFGIGKSGNGAMAPVDWQRGKIGSVISYCLRDVMLTKALFDQIWKGVEIKNPKTGRWAKLPNPRASA